jgi:hypothetical protein
VHAEIEEEIFYQAAPDALDEQAKTCSTKLEWNTPRSGAWSSNFGTPIRATICPMPRSRFVANLSRITSRRRGIGQSHPLNLFNAKPAESFCG